MVINVDVLDIGIFSIKEELHAKANYIGCLVRIR